MNTFCTIKDGFLEELIGSCTKYGVAFNRTVLIEVDHRFGHQLVAVELSKLRRANQPHLFGIPARDHNGAFGAPAYSQHHKHLQGPFPVIVIVNQFISVASVEQLSSTGNIRVKVPTLRLTLSIGQSKEVGDALQNNST